MKRWEGPARERLSSLACAILVVIGCASIAAQAQEAPAAGAAAEQPAIAGEQPTTDKVPAETDLLAPEQLDILVAPVALYPDPLLVLILQGSTFPVDVVAAHRFLGKLPEQPELQPDSDWDSSIVGLLNYPDVVARMDEELDWTEALGESVLNQLEDVQGSIQQVRLQAYMAGMLVTDEHQVVTGSPDLIIVLPADERQIFVPSYDPAAVLAAEPVPLPPVEAAAEPPPEVSAEPAPDEAESVEAVAEAPVEPAPETSVEPGSAPATYQGPQPLPPVYASAPPVVQYSDPSPSFWTGAATFAGGAAIGGLLGYVIGDDDDNDWDWNNDEDWDDIADDVDDIAGDVDELTEGFEDFREDAGDRLDELAEEREQRLDETGERLDEAARDRQERREETADQLQQRREERADALEERRDERADQRQAAAQNREKKKDELRAEHQKHQAKQVQDQLRQRKGLPETGGDRAARQRIAALGDGSGTVAGLAPASVRRPADAPGLAARRPAAEPRTAVQREAGGGPRTTLSPTLARAEAAKPAPRRAGAQVATAQPRSAFSAPRSAREVKKQSVRGAASRTSSRTKLIAHSGGERAVARPGGQRPGMTRGGGGRSKSAFANSRHGGGKVQKAASRGKASRRHGGRGGGRRR
jgi:Protein of unknown function (DUF3300)